jgi:16S rRNA (cytosine967-C5)-methyltransferase
VRPQTPRQIAVEILLARRRRHAFIENLLDDALQKYSLKPEDRRFLQELLFGTVRWQLTLDWLISRKTAGKEQKPVVQEILRTALYQIFWLDRVPNYAAVNESVELGKNLASVGEAKFVNALLRGYGREDQSTRALLAEMKVREPSIGHSHPDWLFKRWEQRWGREHAIQLLDWNNSPPPNFARINTLKTTASDLKTRLLAEGVEFKEIKPDWAPADVILQLIKHPPLSQLASFKEGLFYVQDPSTLLAVELLDAQPGEAILDLCSAPGGKTAYIAQKIENRGRVLAQDNDPARLKLVQENCARLGVSCVTTNPDSFPSETAFDRILIDAPCSNTGVMRRRVELRWRINPEEITRLAALQLDLLKRASARLRIGGTLVYSTCSLEREENTTVVREFLDAKQAFRLESERELLPFKDHFDGAYVAKLILAR